MQKTALLLLGSLFAFSVMAERCVVTELPESGHADTEVSTNIPIASLTGSRKFVVDLSLKASETNCIEVAVGGDNRPANGDLSAAETALAVGWDSGAWILSAPVLTNEVMMAPVSVGADKSLFLRLDIRTDNSTRKITLLDGKQNVLHASFTVPDAASWNMLRVTSRGPSASLDALTVRTSVDGTEVRFR